MSDDELIRELRRNPHGPYWRVRYAAADRILELRRLIMSSEVSLAAARNDVVVSDRFGEGRSSRLRTLTGDAGS